MGAFVFADIAGFAFLAGGDEAEMFGLHSAWTLLHCTRSPGRPLCVERCQSGVSLVITPVPS